MEQAAEVNTSLWEGPSPTASVSGWLAEHLIPFRALPEEVTVYYCCQLLEGLHWLTGYQ